MKTEEKEAAIRLRRAGKTYNEILALVPVAKSTLSEWLQSVHLAKPQRQRITKRRLAAALRGAKARREDRLNQVDQFIALGKKTVGTLSRRDLWLVGIALYWAEGAKQSQRSPSAGLMFANSDARMLRVFLTWLEAQLVPREHIFFELYVHTMRKNDIPSFQRWWAKELHIPLSTLNRVYLKRGKVRTNRTNTGDLYHGLLRIKVNASTVLNRRIAGWVEGIASQ